MPILSPGADEFQGFDVSQPFRSSLHGERILSGGAVSTFYSQLVAATSVYQQWQNFDRMTRLGVAKLAITSGLPGDRVGALATMFEDGPRILQSEIAKVVSQQVIKGALLSFDDALQVVATKVPVVGWVVQVGVAVFETIRGVVTAIKASKKKPPDASAIAYNKGADEELVQLMLDEISSSDWTRYFLPQQKPHDVCTRSLAYTSRGEADGTGWEVCSHDGDPWGWGLTPGLSSRFSGIVGVWQSPKKLRNSTRDAGIESITPFGDLHPSATQFGLALWQMCLKNSAAAFRIDGDAIASAWIDQAELLTDFAYNHAGDWLGKQILNAIEWYVPETGHSRVEPYTPDDLPAQYTQSELWWYAELVRYAVQEVWRPRLSGFLETLTVAYVPPDAPALRADDALADQHHAMRQLLLEHDARRDVDLDLIPDAEYRSAMYTAKLHAVGALAVAPTKRFEGMAIDYVPAVDSSKPLPPEPDSDPAPGVSPTGATGGGAAVLALLGVGAAAVALKRAAGR